MVESPEDIKRERDAMKSWYKNVYEPWVEQVRPIYARAMAQFSASTTEQNGDKLRSSDIPMAPKLRGRKIQLRD